MAVRPATFPIVFAGALALITIGFYNRHKFVTKTEDQQERWEQSQQQARDFQAKMKTSLQDKKSSN